jgi:urea-proton symporter
MGIAIGGAVFPIYACLVWEKANGTGAIVAAIVGTISGLTTWLITCDRYCTSNPGECPDGAGISVDNLGGNYPMLGGNLASIFISMFVHIGFSLAKPQNFDWKTTREIALVEEDGTPEEPTGEDSKEAMEKAHKIMLYAGWGLCLILCVIWPLLTLPAGVFSKSYFTFWVILSIVWGLLATAVGIFLPFWESRESIAAIFKGLATCSPTADASVMGAKAAFPAASYGKADAPQ